MMSADARLSRFAQFLEQDPHNLSLRLQAIALALDAAEWAQAKTWVAEGIADYPDEAALHAHAGFLALYDQDRVLARQSFEANRSEKCAKE